MPDGEEVEPVAEPTLESLQADVRAVATAVAQLTARERVVDGEGAHGSGFGQRVAGQPTGSGGAAERPDLLELAHSGRVGAKSASAEDDYLAVPELLQRAESGYEAVRPVSRVPELFPLSADLTNEYLKQDDRRLHPLPRESLEVNHAEAIDKAFRFRLAFLRRLNEIKRVHGDQGVMDVLRAQHFQPASEHLGSAIFGDFMRDYERRVFEATVASSAKATATLLLEWRLQLQVVGVGEDEAGDAGVAAKVSTSDGVVRLSSELLELCEATFRQDAFGSDELGQRTLDLLSSSLSAHTLKSYAGRLSQFAELFCHDSENISPLEATTATVVRADWTLPLCVSLCLRM
eukprot:jgi/Tetstr1/429241/TSEL_001904.t1